MPWDAASESSELLTIAAKEAPPYVQIRETIRQQIDACRYAPGDRLPSEGHIAGSFHVNRLTARRAVSELVREGVLQRRPGVGTFVVGRKFLRDPTTLTSVWETIKERGMQPSSRVIAKEIVRADASVAEALDLSDGASVYRVCRVRLADGEPIAYQVAYVPVTLFPSLLEVDLSQESLYRLYRRHGYAPAGGEQRIEAAAAGQEIAGYLGIAAGSPVLLLKRITRAVNGELVEYVIGHIRSDRYVICMPLHR